MEAIIAVIIGLFVATNSGVFSTPSEEKKVEEKVSEVAVEKTPEPETIVVDTKPEEPVQEDIKLEEPVPEEDKPNETVQDEANTVEPTPVS